MQKDDGGIWSCGTGRWWAVGVKLGSMNRRGFLSALIASCGLDPERLLYVPGAKLISIPAPSVILAPKRIGGSPFLVYRNGIFQVPEVHYTVKGLKVTFFESLDKDDVVGIDGRSYLVDPTRRGWYPLGTLPQHFHQN